MVLPVESRALGGTGLGRRGAEPPGIDRLRPAFVDEISGDWGGQVMTDLDAVFNAVAKQPFVDAARMGIAGASYGGYAVNWILGHTDRFKVGVSHDGVFNLDSMSMATEELWFPEWEFGGKPWDASTRAQFSKWSPHLFADKIKTPTLIITNELDFRVPVDQGMQMFTVLRRNGVPSEMLVFPDEGHWVLKAVNSRYWHEAVFGWMRKYLSRVTEDGQSMTARSRVVLIWLLVAPAVLAGQSRTVPAPDTTFGFKPGADYKLATYDQSIDYLRKLAASSKLRPPR